MQTTGYADRTALIPPGDNRPGTALAPFRAFVVHETANEDPGATAEMHRRYWSPGGGGRTDTSIHFVVDSTESIQLIPINEQAWHAGDAFGNTTGVGLEICVNSRAGYAVACQKAAGVAARVLKAESMPVLDGTTLRKHGSYPGTTHKQCPQHLNAGDWGVTWLQFVGMVQTAYAALTPSSVWTGPAGTYPVHAALQAYWERSGGLWQADRYCLGYAISPLTDGIQRFERGALRLKADGSINALLRQEW